MIKHKLFLGFTFLEILVLSVMFLFSQKTVAERKMGEVAAKRELVRHLKLTDLSLWTEARYTRHPSQADVFTAFQDSPSSFEHFPAGSIIGPESITMSKTLNPGRP
ncbi:MAG: hypothetical protein WAV13_13285 [Thermodesulfovibrionales bacterium]